MTELKRARANRGRNLRNLIVAMAAVLGLLMLAVRSAPAAEGKKRRVIPVTINKGETYTISGLKKDSATKSKPVKNPNSLTVQPNPRATSCCSAPKAAVGRSTRRSPVARRLLTR